MISLREWNNSGGEPLCTSDNQDEKLAFKVIWHLLEHTFLASALGPTVKTF